MSLTDNEIHKSRINCRSEKRGQGKTVLFFMYYIQKMPEIFVLSYIFTNKRWMDIMKSTYENDSIQNKHRGTHKTKEKSV